MLQVRRGFLTAAITCLPVAFLAGLVLLSFDPLQRLDERSIIAATDFTRGRPALLASLIVWQEVFLPRHVYLAALPVAIWTWRAGLRSRTLWGVATALVGWSIGFGAKLLVQRNRPLLDDPVSHASGYSFPSGHVFNVTMAMACALIIVWPLLRRRSRVLAYGLVAIAVVVAMLTALDRILLGVHYPSDTTAGALLALALVYSSWTGYSVQPADRSGPGSGVVPQPPLVSQHRFGTDDRPPTGEPLEEKRGSGSQGPR